MTMLNMWSISSLLSEITHMQLFVEVVSPELEHYTLPYPLLDWNFVQLAHILRQAQGRIVAHTHVQASVQVQECTYNVLYVSHVCV